jgi:hypothetical protein
MKTEFVTPFMVAATDILKTEVQAEITRGELTVRKVGNTASPSFLTAETIASTKAAGPPSSMPTLLNEVCTSTLSPSLMPNLRRSSSMSAIVSI